MICLCTRMKTRLNPIFQVPNSYGYWVTLLHEEEDEEEEEEEEEDEESVKIIIPFFAYSYFFTCSPP